MNQCSLMNRKRWKYLGGGLLLMGLVVAAYGPGLAIPYYADDFKFFFPVTELHWTDHFFETGSTTGFYRPLQNAALHLTQNNIGMDPVPVHLATLAMHLAMVGLVYEGARWLGATQMQAFIAALLMGIAQANAAAVLGNDTFSQVASTFFGYLSLRCYGRVLARQEGGGKNAYAGALVSLGTCLLLKETGFAFVLLVVLAELYDGCKAYARRPSRLSIDPAGRIMRLLPVFILGGVYLVVRSVAGAMSPGFGPDPYQLHFGLNLIRNVGLLGAAAVSPISTTDLALWVQTSQWANVIAALCAGSLFVSAVAYGLYKIEHKREVTEVAFVCVCSLSPVLFLNDISELYVYTAMPSLCVIAGIGLGRLLHEARPGSKIGVFVSVLILGYGGGQVLGVWEKARLMNTTGERVQTVLDQIVDVAKTAPSGTTLCLQQHRTDTTAYSVYRMPGAAPLIFAEPVVRYQSQRPDLHFTVGRPHCALQSDFAIYLQLRQEGWNLVQTDTPIHE